MFYSTAVSLPTKEFSFLAVTVKRHSFDVCGGNQEGVGWRGQDVSNFTRRRQSGPNRVITGVPHPANRLAARLESEPSLPSRNRRFTLAPKIS